MSQRERPRAKESESDEETLRYLVALKLILGADGLHPKEARALSRGMELMGVAPHMVDQVERFDPRGARLEDWLPENPPIHRARMLVYDAIRLANADAVYSDAERAAVVRAAKAMGVDGFSVRALEGLVEMERAVERMRRALLQGA